MAKSFKPRGFRVKGMSIKQVRSKAQRLRAFFERDNEPYINVVQLLDNLSANGFVDFDVIDDSEWSRDDELAFFVPAENMIYIRQSTNDLATLGDGHSRFTIAHEIGHWILHRNIRLSRSSIASTKHSAYEDSEWQADTFAAELLINRDFLSDSDSATDIKARFGVSTACAGVYLKREKRS